MEEKVKEVIANRIRPALQMDGGDIEYHGLEGNKVKVRLVGACCGCAHASHTLQLGVLRMLQQEVPEVEGVVPI